MDNATIAICVVGSLVFLSLLAMFIIWGVIEVFGRRTSTPTIVDTELLESVDSKCSLLLPLLEERDDLAEQLNVLQEQFALMSADLKDAEEWIETLKTDQKTIEQRLYDLDWDGGSFAEHSDIEDDDWPEDDEWGDDSELEEWDDDDSTSEWEPDCGSPTEVDDDIPLMPAVDPPSSDCSNCPDRPINQQHCCKTYSGVLSDPNAASILAGASMVSDDLQQLTLLQSITLPADQWDVRHTDRGYELSRKTGGDFSG